MLLCTLFYHSIFCHNICEFAFNVIGQCVFCVDDIHPQLLPPAVDVCIPLHLFSFVIQKTSQCFGIIIMIIIIIVRMIMFMVLSSWKSTSRVHPVHMMNVERRQAAAEPQTRPNDPVCESSCRLPEATPTSAIYYYYSARKLILLLPSHGG